MELLYSTLPTPTFFFCYCCCVSLIMEKKRVRQHFLFLFFKSLFMAASSSSVARAPGSGAPDSGTVAVSNFQRMVVILLCSVFLYISNVVPGMFSGKTNSTFMIFMLLFFTAYSMMWLYASTVLSKRKAKLVEEHKNLLLSATCCGLLGSLCWIIGMWPVFHIFSIPIWMVIAVLVVNLHGLSFPSLKRKSE